MIGVSPRYACPPTHGLPPWPGDVIGQCGGVVATADPMGDLEQQKGAPWVTCHARDGVEVVETGAVVMHPEHAWHPAAQVGAFTQQGRVQDHAVVRAIGPTDARAVARGGLAVVGVQAGKRGIDVIANLQIAAHQNLAECRPVVRGKRERQSED
jgi:hypothetical protein